MSFFKDVLGMNAGPNVRYAIVGLGDISQEAMLPGISSTGNSEVVAFVTSDPQKAREVGERYGVEDSYAYDEFDKVLQSGTIDAIYLATPNWRHAEFVVPALRAGIHVLVEKPFDVSSDECRKMIDAQKASTAKLMVAYRLHFEPATMALIRKIRAGDLGRVHLFASTFSQMIDPQNHRAKNGELAGPLLDMGPYPVNASRYVFGAEPTKVVSAVGTRHPESGLGDFEDTVAVTLQFPEGRLAQFVVSYYANSVDAFYAVGTKGSIFMNPAYLYGSPLEQVVTIGEDEKHEKFKNTDHFGGQMQYFSECILAGRDPEPDGEEGLADVRVLEAILEALETGTSVDLPPFERTRRIDPDAQERTLPAHRSPELVNASNPGRDTEKQPLNLTSRGGVASLA